MVKRTLWRSIYKRIDMVWFLNWISSISRVRFFSMLCVQREKVKTIIKAVQARLRVRLTVFYIWSIFSLSVFKRITHQILLQKVLLVIFQFFKSICWFLSNALSFFTNALSFFTNAFYARSAFSNSGINSISQKRIITQHHW